MTRIPVPNDCDLQPVETVPIKKEEAREQARLVAALRRRWSVIADESQRPLIFAVPNGGSRDAREAANLKTQGVLAGVPDLGIILPCGEICWIEMKASDGRVSGSQTLLHAHFDKLGHEVITAYSAEEALAALRKRLY